MGNLVVVLVTLAFVGAILGSIPWMASSARRHSAGGNVLGPFEEIWHPAAYNAHVEIQEQQQRPAPAPLPGDPPEPGDGD